MSCVDCGADISSRHVNAYLCLDCRANRERAKGRRQQSARRARRAKGYMPHRLGRTPCVTIMCRGTFERTRFNLSRIYCDDCAVFFQRERKVTAHARYRKNPEYRARDAAYHRARYWRQKIRRAA